MSRNSRIQYTIRGIPRDVDQELRRRAHERKVSLNELLVAELTNITAGSGRCYRSLKHLAGKWKEDAEFDRILKDQRPIDWNLWR